MRFVFIFLCLVAFNNLDVCHSDCPNIQITGKNETFVDIICHDRELLWVKPQSLFDYIKFSLIQDPYFYPLLNKANEEYYLALYQSSFKTDQWNFVDFSLVKHLMISHKPVVWSLEATVNDKVKYHNVTKLSWWSTMIKYTKIFVRGNAKVSFNCALEAPLPNKIRADTKDIISNKTTFNPYASSWPSILTSNRSKYTIPGSPISTTVTKIPKKTAKLHRFYGPMNATNTYSVLKKDEIDELIYSKISINETAAVREIRIIIVGFIAAFLILLLILIELVMYHKGKLKKLGGNDLSTIESIDPKNMINHYEEVLKYGKKDNKDYEEQKVKQDAMKDIQWNVANELSDSKSDQKEDEFCYDKPKSVLSEAEETIYEELPDDLKP